MKPASFNLTDIQAMFQHEVTSVHECAGHVGCARFLKFCPGWVNTEMDMADPAGGSYTDADIVGRVPMARFATPDEVARAIAFLADTEDSSFINGQALAVDRGWTADASWESLRLRRR